VGALTALPSERIAPAERVVATAKPVAELPGAAPVAGDRELDVEVASSDPNRVQAFLAQRLARWIDIPTFRGRARLVGASAAPSDATAQLLYRYGKENVTLQVSPHTDPTLPEQGIVVRRDGSHQVARWQRDGFTYSMTSLLDPVEMVRLAAAELSERPEPMAAPPWTPMERNFSEARPVSSTEP
jgi:hypothetical protein